VDTRPLLRLEARQTLTFCAAIWKARASFISKFKTFVPGNITCSVGRKAERYVGETFFWVLGGIPTPRSKQDFEYYVIPSVVMAANVKRAHQMWLSEKGAKGQKRNDNNVRTVHLPPRTSYSGWDISDYRDRWDLIEAKLNEPFGIERTASTESIDNTKKKAIRKVKSERGSWPAVHYELTAEQRDMARRKRDKVRVDGKLYGSVYKAFVALHLLVEQHEAFRGDLKHMVRLPFTFKGRTYEFEIAS
jgi:hypothetical protein